MHAQIRMHMALAGKLCRHLHACNATMHTTATQQHSTTQHHTHLHKRWKLVVVAHEDEAVGQGNWAEAYGQGDL